MVILFTVNLPNAGVVLSAAFNIIALRLEDNCQLIIFPVKKNESKQNT